MIIPKTLIIVNPFVRIMLKKIFTFTLSLTLLLGVLEISTQSHKTFIEGYANTPNLDRYGTIIPVSAFQSSVSYINKNTLPLYLNHRYQDSFLLGKIIRAKSTAKGMLIRCELRNDLNERYYNSIVNGYYAFFSIGGTPIKYDPASNIINEFDLFEVSVVGMPANRESKITKVYTERIGGLVTQFAQDLLEMAK